MAMNETTPTAPETAARSLHWGDFLTINFYFIGLGYLWQSLHLFALAAILPLMVGRENQGTALGILLVAGLIFAIVVQPMAGALSDRLVHKWGRRRPFMILGTLGALIFLGGIAWAFAQPLTKSGITFSFMPIITNADYWILFLMYCLLQFSSNVAHGAAQGLIPDLVAPAQRGAAAGVKSIIDNGMLIAVAYTVPGIATAPGDIVIGYQNVIGIVAIVLLVSLGINFIAIREIPITADQAPTTSPNAALRRTFHISSERDPDYVWLLTSRLFILAGAGILRGFSLFYIQDIIVSRQPNAAALATLIQGNLIGTIGALVLLISIPAGILSDRYGRKRLNIVGAVIAGVGAALILLTRGGLFAMIAGLEISDLMAAGLVFGLGIGLFTSVNWAWATDLVPEKEAGRYLGISNLATGGSQILAILAGVLLDLFNRQTFGSGYNVIFILAAVWLVLGAILSNRVRETRGPNAVTPTPVADTK